MNEEESCNTILSSNIPLTLRAIPLTYKYPPSPPNPTLTCSSPATMPAYRSYRSRKRVSRRKPRYTKRRPTRYMKRRYPRKRITSRYIQNVSAEKKSDSRVFFSNIADAGEAPVFANPVFNGGTLYVSIHMPTAMDKSSDVAQDIGNYRDRSNIYMKGYRESFRMTSTGGDSWNHRRIVFTYKGEAIRNAHTTLSPLYLESSTNGWTRTWTNHLTSTAGNALYGIIFKGALNIDWVDIFTASLDRTKINVLHDRYNVYKAGNGENNIYNRKFYTPFNSMFYYDDEEAGDTEAERLFHTTTNRGLGDVYVVDLFQCADNNPSNRLEIAGSSRLYWHEK